MRAAPRARLDGWLRLIDDTDRELRSLTAELSMQARAEPRAAVLKQLPGVGDWVALVVLAEVGDIDRFPTPSHLCSWAGLAPKVRTQPSGQR